MLNFGNLMTAMVTTFNENLEVDYNQLEVLSNYLVENGTTTLVLCGTTGESPTLTKDEKINIVRHVRESISKNIPIVAGTGSYSTKESIELSIQAEKAGANALLVVNPYYNKPNQKGLYEHFKAIAESVSIEIVLYNHPGRTGVCIDPETLQKLSEIKNITCIKDSSGNLDLISQYKLAVGDNLKIYSGDDSLNLPIYSLGGVGAVSVASHIAGKDISKMFNLLENNNFKEAQKIHYKLFNLFKILFCAPSPAPTKYALYYKGIIKNPLVRLPITSLNENEKIKIEEVIKNI
ncbi:MAG: 4-hydroxy-tetrahydrodipicolinate synthase [Candidatus Sericytochromatia bacterium]|nr:MAG: 4-hydroxy-tetrahydrodipicolinate synthase [Candidatus Sericytochromatia bacterium]